MKITLNTEKIVKSCYDYAFDIAFFKENEDQIVLQNVDKTYMEDSLLEFFYNASNKHPNFEKTKFFLTAVCQEHTSLEDIIAFCKGLIYPLLEKNSISTTIYSLEEGWNLVYFFDEPLFFIRMNQDLKQVFIAFSEKSSSKTWNTLFLKDNFFKLLKSKIIEELINAQIFR